MSIDIERGLVFENSLCLKCPIFEYNVNLVSFQFISRKSSQQISEKKVVKREKTKKISFMMFSFGEQLKIFYVFAFR